jgi:undecaprenyl phosphate N,N'-diacetylbacillosamine 1-phosphate transferase
MRSLDIVLSLVAILILAVLLPLLIVLIKLDSKGSVFFRQERLGQMGRVFKVLKFRTMHTDARGMFNPDGSRFVAQSDLRITRVGRFLRLGLDELPQTFNILKGEMSFIGPRPDDVFATQHYSGLEWLKLSATPGITGLAQVTGRNQLPWHTRMKYDIFYAYNRSLGMDLKIIWRTLAMLANIEVTRPVVTSDEVESFLLSPHLLADADAIRTKIEAIQP